MKSFSFLLMLCLFISTFPRRAHAEYNCRTGLSPTYCQFAKQCVANGHHVWERQFADWLCYDEHGKLSRKQCKESSQRAAGVIDFHHFGDGTCHFVFSKKG